MIPFDVIYILDEMSGIIEGKMAVIFRNRAVNQAILLKIAVQQPGDGSDIPDSSGPGGDVAPARSLADGKIYQIVTELVFSAEMVF